MEILYFAFLFLLVIIMWVACMRVRQGMNEGKNTPIAMAVLVICLALLCSLEIK